MKLTKGVLHALKPNEIGEVFLSDDDVQAWGLTGEIERRPLLIVQYGNSSGASRRMTLGKFWVLTSDEARKMAK
jgi:hypothetical protein